MKFDLKLLIVLLAVVMVSAVGSAYVTSWVFSSRTPVAAGPNIPTAARPPSPDPFTPELVWDAGEFTVNLASVGGRGQFIKTGLSFRMNEKESVTEIERRRVQVQDRIITILRTTTADQLNSSEGFNAFKQRLTDELNELIVDDGARIREVYFSGLVIQ